MCPGNDRLLTPIDASSALIPWTIRRMRLLTLEIIHIVHCLAGDLRVYFASYGQTEAKKQPNCSIVKRRQSSREIPT